VLLPRLSSKEERGSGDVNKEERKCAGPKPYHKRQEIRGAGRGPRMGIVPLSPLELSSYFIELSRREKGCAGEKREEKKQTQSLRIEPPKGRKENRNKRKQGGSTGRHHSLSITTSQGCRTKMEKQVFTQKGEKDNAEAGEFIIFYLLNIKSHFKKRGRDRRKGKRETVNF